jgi:LEA14-like dessication related protein
MLLLSIFLIGCVDIQQPTVTFTGQNVINIDIQKVQMELYLDIANPNTLGIEDAFYEYALSINKKRFLSQEKIPLSIPANQVTKVIIPVDLYYERIFDAAGDMIALISRGQRNLPYTLKGKVIINVLSFNFDLPFDHNGVIPLPDIVDPKIDSSILNKIENFHLTIPTF